MYHWFLVNHIGALDSFLIDEISIRSEFIELFFVPLFVFLTQKSVLIFLLWAQRSPFFTCLFSKLRCWTMSKFTFVGCIVFIDEREERCTREFRQNSTNFKLLNFMLFVHKSAFETIRIVIEPKCFEFFGFLLISKNILILELLIWLFFFGSHFYPFFVIYFGKLNHWKVWVLLFDIWKNCFLVEEICWNTMFWLGAIINLLLLLSSSFLWLDRLLLCFTLCRYWSSALLWSNNFCFCRHFLFNLFDFFGSSFDRYLFTFFNFWDLFLQNLSGLIGTGWCSGYLLFGNDNNSFGLIFLSTFVRILWDGRILWEFSTPCLSFWHFFLVRVCKKRV